MITSDEMDSLLEFCRRIGVPTPETQPLDALIWMRKADEWSERAIKAEAENAKLRELVGIMAYCMQDGKECDGCVMNGGRERLEIDPLFACDGLYDRMRELGIEVDS